MSIIQDIRDKYAKLTVVLVALALLGFILTDYFSGKSRASGNVAITIGSVNGNTIGFEEFNQKVIQAEENLKTQGYSQGAALTQQALEQAWNQEIGQLLLKEELKALGVSVGKKELADLLYGPGAPQDLQNQFKDPQTGVFNPALAKQNIDQALKSGTPEQKTNIVNYIDALANMRMADKYLTLFSNSINFPRWIIEKQNAENSQLARLSFVRELYTSVPDSAVKISNEEIKDYINKNKTQFKQQESRTIQYVVFGASPSAADSAAALSSLNNQKERFASSDNVERFLAGEGAPYYNGYINGKSIQQAVKDSLFGLAPGATFGPYLEADRFLIARMVGVTRMPDTVSIRHILISTQNRDSATAYNLCDSLQKAIAGGTSFDSLTAKFSDDPGSKNTGGKYENVSSGQMVAPFNDFIFLKSTGAKGIVKTDFGFHYIEILSQKGGGSGYKIAYLPQEIVASQETDNLALNKANEFAGDSKDLKSFNANYEKKLKTQGVVKSVATDISPISYEVRGVGASRSFVRAIYEAEMGDVLKPERIDNNYIVAVVTEANKEGTTSVETARLTVDPVLRNKKKAELLSKKIGTITTLEAAASALGGKQIETIDSIRFAGSFSFGYEPRVAGAAFNMANKGKVVSAAIEGLSGVFVVRVDNIGSTPVLDGDVVSLRESRYQQAKQAYANQYSPNNPVSILRSAATIKDRRQERY
ncbi:MAG: peptidylprolyl isomerase [Bacteroidetes bacterium]|nr:peptidylprolyl isomerase [Bacteroidota bacterium]